jgi:unconventional prefoldin RPB5 interactor 1
MPLAMEVNSTNLKLWSKGCECKANTLRDHSRRQEEARLWQSLGELVSDFVLFRSRNFPFPSTLSICIGCTMDSAVLERIELQRQALQENVSKLRQSLRHWQNLELDYEGLKEELELLPQTASTEQCLQTGRDFQAVVVSEKDLHDLLIDPRAGKRSPQQLADLLSKRVDYVSRNANTVRKQISAEEKKLNALLLVEDPDHREDAGLPLTEITEELDDSGNVISSKMERPGEGVSGLVEVLQKAGVEGLNAKDGKLQVEHDQASTEATVATSTKASTGRPRLADEVQSDSDSEVEDEVPRRDIPVRVPIPGENPIPVSFRDTEEEAKMRREMLEYGLNEVGAIVAELDLQEGASDVSYDEDDEEVGLIMDSDFEDDDDDEVSEDELGRVKNPAISEKYKQKMEELQKKLGLTDLKNLGPTPDLPQHLQDALDRPPAAEAARKAALAREEATAKSSAPSSNSLKKGNRPKKSVAFAQELEIADQAEETQPKDPTITKPAVNPMGETVMERTESVGLEATPPPPAPAPTKPSSRFRAARQAMSAAPNLVPESLASHTKSKATSSNKQSTALSKPEQAKERPLVAPTVLERSTTESPSAPDPFDIDEDMHRREIAMEYHKLRNRRVHGQGGFVRGDPQEDDEMDDMLSNNVLEDPETGEVKRVSRFKAARLLR